MYLPERIQNSKFTTWHYFEVKQKVTTRNTCYEIKYAYLLLVLILSKVIDTPGLQYQIILKYNWDSFEKVPNYFQKFLVFYFLLSQQLKSILMYNYFFLKTDVTVGKNTVTISWFLKLFVVKVAILFKCKYISPHFCCWNLKTFCMGG